MRSSGLILVLVTLVLCDTSDFECPVKADCSCSRGIKGDFELLCPKNPVQPSLSVKIQPASYVQVQCTLPKSQIGNDLELLKGLEIGPVNTFMFRLCPLPSSSFKDLMLMAGVPNIRTLQVQSYSNLSNTLTKAHLGGLLNVSQINFASNFLTEVPEDLFQETSNLTWLDMKNNNLKLPKGIFRSVPKLEVLELGSNNITYLEPGIFRNLTKLRLLNLWGNRLQNISRSLFSDLPNLENLDLNSNSLVTLPPDIFADLPNLKIINLHSNDFFSLPQGLFLSNPKLEKVQIHNNRRSLRSIPPGLLANLTHLREVYLNDCNLTQLPEDLFWGSVLLINLTLQRNLLIELPVHLLKDNKDLQKLDLSQNRIKFIPDEFFKNQDKLTHLNLAHNKLTSLSGVVFSSLGNLETLNLKNNLIEYISPQAFQVNVALKVVNLSNNRLSVFYAEYTDPTFGRHSLLQSSVKLESLYLSNNNISELYADWQISMTTLEILDLSHNQLTNLTIEDLQFVSPKLTLDLSYNQISLIAMDTAEKLALMKFTTLPIKPLENNSVRVILKGNPLQCDCHAYSLVRYLRGEMSPEVEYLVDFDATNLTCFGPLGFEKEVVKGLDPRLLTCRLTRKGDCPKRCGCYFRPADKALFADCAMRNLTELPDSLPTNRETKYYTNHTELDVTGNRITELPGILGPGYERVTKLFMGFNNVTSVNISGLSPDLQVLELHNNNLTRASSHFLKGIEKAKNMKILTLRSNPWRCDCLARDFLNSIHTNFKVILDFANITCSNKKLFTNMTESDLCPISALDVRIFTSIVAVIGLIVCISTVLYFRYQQEIRVWLYAKGLCLWFVTEEELDKDKIYDAFISYSHQDEPFVVDKLVPGLETDGPTKYKLCLHYRDWIVGDFIPNQIMRSVEEARRTIVVLSPNFIESVWGRMEFRTAHSKAISEGRARVIVVLYGEVGNIQDLDPELKAYLSMNTYVKWGDPWFWDKIRYAMPHLPGISKGLPLISRKKGKSSNIQKIMEEHVSHIIPTSPEDPLKGNVKSV